MTSLQVALLKVPTRQTPSASAQPASRFLGSRMKQAGWRSLSPARDSFTSQRAWRFRFTHQIARQTFGGELTVSLQDGVDAGSRSSSQILLRRGLILSGDAPLNLAGFGRRRIDVRPLFVSLIRDLCQRQEFGDLYYDTRLAFGFERLLPSLADPKEAGPARDLIEAVNAEVAVMEAVFLARRSDINRVLLNYHRLARPV